MTFSKVFASFLLLSGLLVTTTARAETAENNYALYCAQCHGVQANGEGINYTSRGLSVTPRDHRSAPDMARLSDKDLRTAISEGGVAVDKSAQMPAWKGVLSEAEIDAMVVYLRQLCQCQGPKS